MKKVFFTCCCFSAATVAFAGSPAKVDSLKVVNLQEVQVVSTRASEKTPMAYSNLSKKSLEAQNFGQDIPFLLQLTPSVVTSSDAGTGIGYTGIHVRGTDPTRINVTANGIPINDSESNEVYWVNMADFASSLGNLQIQRGVGTSTNGAGAFGASVNMMTEEIPVLPYVQLDGSFGSYGTQKETFKFGSGIIGNHWAFDGRLSNISSDGYIKRASAKLDSYFLQGGYFNKNTVIKFITFNGQEKTYHAWNYATKEEMLQHGRTYNSCGEYYNGNDTLYYKNQTDFYQQQHYQLFWNQILSPSLNLNVALHYTHGFGYYEEYKLDQLLSEYNLSSSLGSNSDLVRQTKEKNDFYGTVFSLNYQSNKWKTSLGGGWNKFDGDHYGNVIWVKNFNGSLLPDFEYYRNKGKKTDGNIYGKADYEILKGLYAYADLQYRHINYKINGSTDAYSKGQQKVFNYNNSFDFFNPKMGLYWNISPNHVVYGSYALAHKEPTRNDYENNPNPLPKAERLNDWELGYKYSSSIFSASANFYYMNYRDQFVLTGEINKIGELISKNVGSSYREGLELTAAFSPCKSFRWDANATFCRNRAKSWTIKAGDNGEEVNLGDTHLSYSPSVIANNILTYKIKKFTAMLQSQYVGKQYMTNTDDKTCMLDAYFVSNLNLAYTFKLPYTKEITVGATIYNLFNEKYESNGYAENSFNHDKSLSYSYAAYSAQAPTNFLAHVSICF